jgi:magnesium-protoporphyrin O-methyltransferase
MPSAPTKSAAGQIEAYFDRTAADAWKRLTSDAPVSGIRATVRAGRDEMRATLLGWLPADLTGKRLLDAGCGTGMLALEAARRGAEVYAVDLSPTLIENARERLPDDLAGRSSSPSATCWRPGSGRFRSCCRHGLADPLRIDDAAGRHRRARRRGRGSMVFTFAPRTPAAGADARRRAVLPAQRPLPGHRAGAAEGACAAASESDPASCAAGASGAPSASPAASTPRRRWS